MIKIWGRNTSVNVQKVMWALGELGSRTSASTSAAPSARTTSRLPRDESERAGADAQEEDGFPLWESNSIVRYLAAKIGAGTLEPADLRARARASSWMDWQLSVAAPRSRRCSGASSARRRKSAIPTAIEAGKDKTIAAMQILDAQLAKTRSSPATHSPWATSRSADGLSLPQLVPERPALDNLERWFAAIEQRPAFKEHVAVVRCLK